MKVLVKLEFCNHNGDETYYCIETEAELDISNELLKSGFTYNPETFNYYNQTEESKTRIENQFDNNMNNKKNDVFNIVFIKPINIKTKIIPNGWNYWNSDVYVKYSFNDIVVNTGDNLFSSRLNKLIWYNNSKNFKYITRYLRSGSFLYLYFYHIRIPSTGSYSKQLFDQMKTCYYSLKNN